MNTKSNKWMLQDLNGCLNTGIQNNKFYSILTNNTAFANQNFNSNGHESIFFDSTPSSLSDNNSSLRDVHIDNQSDQNIYHYNSNYSNNPTNKYSHLNCAQQIKTSNNSYDCFQNYYNESNLNKGTIINLKNVNYNNGYCGPNYDFKGSSVGPLFNRNYVEETVQSKIRSIHSINKTTVSSKLDDDHLMRNGTVEPIITHYSDNKQNCNSIYSKNFNNNLIKRNHLFQEPILVSCIQQQLQKEQINNNNHKVSCYSQADKQILFYDLDIPNFNNTDNLIKDRDVQIITQTDKTSTNFCNSQIKQADNFRNIRHISSISNSEYRNENLNRQKNFQNNEQNLINKRKFECDIPSEFSQKISRTTFNVTEDIGNNSIAKMPVGFKENFDFEKTAENNSSINISLLNKSDLHCYPKMLVQDAFESYIMNQNNEELISFDSKNSIDKSSEKTLENDYSSTDLTFKEVNPSLVNEILRNTNNNHSVTYMSENGEINLESGNVKSNVENNVSNDVILSNTSNQSIAKCESLSCPSSPKILDECSLHFENCSKFSDIDIRPLKEAEHDIFVEEIDVKPSKSHRKENNYENKINRKKLKLLIEFIENDSEYNTNDKKSFQNNFCSKEKPKDEKLVVTNHRKNSLETSITSKKCSDSLSNSFDINELSNSYKENVEKKFETHKLVESRSEKKFLDIDNDGSKLGIKSSSNMKTDNKNSSSNHKNSSEDNISHHKSKIETKKKKIICEEQRQQTFDCLKLCSGERIRKKFSENQCSKQLCCTKEKSEKTSRQENTSNSDSNFKVKLLEENKVKASNVKKDLKKNKYLTDKSKGKSEEDNNWNISKKKHSFFKGKKLENEHCVEKSVRSKSDKKLENRILERKKKMKVIFSKKNFVKRENSLDSKKSEKKIENFKSHKVTFDKHVRRSSQEELKDSFSVKKDYKSSNIKKSYQRKDIGEGAKIKNEPETKFLKGNIVKQNHSFESKCQSKMQNESKKIFSEDRYGSTQNENPQNLVKEDITFDKNSSKQRNHSSEQILKNTNIITEHKNNKHSSENRKHNFFSESGISEKKNKIESSLNTPNSGKQNHVLETFLKESNQKEDKCEDKSSKVKKLNFEKLKSINKEKGKININTSEKRHNFTKEEPEIKEAKLNEEKNHFGGESLKSTEKEKKSKQNSLTDKEIIDVLKDVKKAKLHKCSKCLSLLPNNSFWINAVSGKVSCSHCIKKSLAAKNNILSSIESSVKRKLSNEVRNSSHAKDSSKE